MRLPSNHLAAAIFVAGLFVVAASEAAEKQTRPGQPESPTEVSLSLLVLDLDELDGASQSFFASVYLEARWMDPDLAHEGPDEVSYRMHEIWHPRLVFVNEQRLNPSLPELLEVTPEGQVIQRQRFWGSFSQPLMLRDFPFDEQQLTLQLVAAGFEPRQVKLVVDPELSSGVSRKLSIPDWDVEEVTFKADPYYFNESGSPAPGMTLTVSVDRRYGYYISRVFLPLLFIVAMSFTVFWIDPLLTDTQVNVSVTSMLTLIAYRLTAGEVVPPVSYMTKMDLFIVGVTTLVFAALLEVVITSGLARSKRLEAARRFDRVSRIGYPCAFLVLCAWVSLI